VAHHALAGEASLCWSTPQRPKPKPKRKAAEEDRQTDDVPVLVIAADPERSAESSAQRARTTLRRWCTSLGVDRLGTLTFRCRRCKVPTGCVCPQGPARPTWDEYDEVLTCIEAFRRAMRKRYGVVPLALVVEVHADGHLHVHFGVNRFINQAQLAACWPHGFVKMTRANRPKGQHIGRREQARRCASYLAKYIGKGFEGGTGRKSYSTTRGLVPKPQRMRFMRRSEAMGWLLDVNGRGPASVWSSADVEGWEAPPCWLMFWDDPPPEGGS
jgi:hypothetical protein